MTSPRPLIAVHGFMFDPADKGGSNDPAGFFREMQEVTGREVDGFAWYSAPFGLRIRRPFHSAYQTARAWLSSWATGHLHPYRYAWDLAELASQDLAKRIYAYQGKVDLVAHSLGARVVLEALWRVSPSRVGRVVIFNGAELSRNAEHQANCTNAEILNVAARCDRVLDWLGDKFCGDRNGPCIGQAGLTTAPENWRDLFLDDEAVQRTAKERRGWELRANNPRDLLDHWDTYRFPGNRELVRAWFAGDRLSDLTVHLS